MVLFYPKGREKETGKGMKTRETSRGRRAWQPLLPRSANTEQLLSHLDLDVGFSASLEHHGGVEMLHQCSGHR